jgi:anhydro-N-acetylmuramic acid kinase
MAGVLAAIGLMSGTSMDGVDVALVETDGERLEHLGKTGYRPYSRKERDLLRAALVDAVGMTDRNARSPILQKAEKVLTTAHVEAVENFLKENGIERKSVAIVGFHGQTVLHRPDRKLTIQIGDGAALAKKLSLPVAYDFRAADTAAGGQGAPLVPVFHRALAESFTEERPLAVLNIGGVANITLLDDGNDPIAFDTGPGNAPIDDLIRGRNGATHDAEGALAATGKVDERIVVAILSDPFFTKAPPKSLDRAAFSRLPLDGLSDADAAATATAVVAASIAKAIPLLPKLPRMIIVAGGGARNKTLLEMLGARALVPVKTANEIGWSGDALEAQAFAFLAVRALKGLPITFPSTTGVSKPMPGGVIVRP